MSFDGAETPMETLVQDYSIGAPALIDHRKKHTHPPGATVMSGYPRAMDSSRPDVPSVEVHHPTPQGSTLDPSDLLKIDNQLRKLPPNMSPLGPSVARDFKQAVSDVSDDGIDASAPAGRRGSTRRDARRGRPRDMRLVDRSRDTSSSRSTSPANSVEAFAEPRRRQRANTVGSVADSVDLQKLREGAYSETRRPTLSSVSVPAYLTTRSNAPGDDDRNANFRLDEEPGKTYRIDFEELEEFVALCKQGKIPVESTTSGSESDTTEKKVFHDRRAGAAYDGTPNAALNGETFFEKCDQDVLNRKPTDTATHQIAPADRFAFFSTDVQQPKTAKSLPDLVKDTKFQDLFDVGPEGGVWWLDVLNPTRAELDVIASAFKIHRLTREDIETQEPREKVELFGQYYFVCFRSFNMNRLSEDFLDPIHVYIVVTQDGVISFSYTPNPHVRNVWRRISKLGDFVSLGPDYICYALIDDIVDSFAPVIRHAETESENIEDQVFIARDEDFSALLRQIGEARKRVLNMMRLLGGKADVIKGFAKRCNEQFEMTPRGDIGLYLGDIQDHVVTMMSNLGHVEKMLSRSHANYLAQLNVDHLLKGNHTSKTLGRVTVVATILVPLNLITGLFGMNVHVPGAGSESFAWFGGIVGAIFLFVCCALITARRMKLI